MIVFQNVNRKKENRVTRARELARWLAAIPALAKDSRSVPSIQIRWLTTACISNSRRFNFRRSTPSFELLGYLPLTCVHASLSTPCLRVSSAVIKYHVLGRKAFVSLLLLHDSPSSEGFFPGTQRKELKQRTWRNTTYWLAPYDLLHLVSYNSQDQQPRVGTTHSKLAPPTLIINQLFRTFCLFLRICILFVQIYQVSTFTTSN